MNEQVSVATRSSSSVSTRRRAWIRASYRICTRCIMDTTDPLIEFDEQGVCNHCKFMEFKLGQCVRPEPERLAGIVEEVKAAGSKRRYDCILGISGGTDSTYVAYLVQKLGLRPLAVHLDNGWNSELAVKNIENVLNKLGIDLVTHVLDWEEFRDLQVSFLKASTPDSEVPTDHAIIAVLLKMATAEKIRYIISGHNMRTEGVLPSSWSYGGFDWRYIKSLQKRFGTRKLRSFPHFSLGDRIWNYFVRKLRFVHILNYVDYRKEDAMAVLERELGWRAYGGKHCESIYTRFFQSYILPRKFNIDKRRAHLSALIVSGQITRAQALAEVGRSFSEEALQEDRQYVIKKLALTEEQFEAIMRQPPRSYWEYPTYAPLLARVHPLVAFAQRRGLLAPRIGL